MNKVKQLVNELIINIKRKYCRIFGGGKYIYYSSPGYQSGKFNSTSENESLILIVSNNFKQYSDNEKITIYSFWLIVNFNECKSDLYWHLKVTIVASPLTLVWDVAVFY